MSNHQIGIITAVACIILLAYLFIKRNLLKNERTLRNAALSANTLDDYAKRVALTHGSFGRRRHPVWPVIRLEENLSYIDWVYKILHTDIQSRRAIPAPAEWLMDNFYVIEEQASSLKLDLVKKHHKALPVITTGAYKGQSRIFSVASEFIARMDGQVDENALQKYLVAYEEQSVLSEAEIAMIPIMLKLALIETLRHLCERIHRTDRQWQKVDDIFKEYLADSEENETLFTKLFQSTVKSENAVNVSFLEHLSYKIRISGHSNLIADQIMDEHLMKFGTSTSDIVQREHHAQSVYTVSMANCITSLQDIGGIDWEAIYKATSQVERILAQDPDGTYSQMDDMTRNTYKRSITTLARQYACSELHIAKEAVLLAGNASKSEIPGAHVHVGYYLIGAGTRDLRARQRKNGGAWHLTELAKQKAQKASYVVSSLLLTFTLAGMMSYYAFVAASTYSVFFALLSGLAALLPASEMAIYLSNAWIARRVKPAFIPALSLREGIPETLRTAVIIPTLLPSIDRVGALMETMENHYLANREKNLYFVLISAFGDADSMLVDEDAGILDAAIKGVRGLNARYTEGKDIFYFFHRERRHNESNDVWIGWERKRGALLEFNDLLLGSEETSFAHASNWALPKEDIRYVITLDSDTVLPMGMAKRMIAAMAHPLNRPVVDPVRGIVVDGFGLMQPSVNADVVTAKRSLFSRIFTNQDGIDPYTNAVSDIYQDVFGEGSYTGKGIYDVAAFQQVLQNAFPENAILSHDLLEGAYLRAGFVSRLSLIDSFPTRYNAYVTRQYRWVRGDWQLLPRLLPKARHGAGEDKIANPISNLSKWKIADNLRRSMIAPSLMLLIVLAATVLPGHLLTWLSFACITLLLPQLLSTITLLTFSLFRRKRTKRYMPVNEGIRSLLLQGFSSIVFLPHQAWLMVSAIGKTLRRLVTGKNMLEWVTMADVERSQPNSLRSYWALMWAVVPQAILAVLLPLLLGHENVWWVLPLALLWIASPFIAYQISKDTVIRTWSMPADDERMLRIIARKTWRYFEEFSNAKSNHLTPDNYQEDPPRTVAHRTSPTNIGIGLMAIVTARDMGFIGTVEMLNLTDKTITSIESLEKWQGHLYNWYDTTTATPLSPRYVSTVDSGNLLGYLMTLSQGLRDYLDKPLVDGRLVLGLRDTMHCAGEDGARMYDTIASEYRFDDETLRIDSVRWEQFLHAIQRAAAQNPLASRAWAAKIAHTLSMHKEMLTDYMPAVAMGRSIPAQIMQRRECEQTLFNLFEKLNHGLSLNALSAESGDAARRVREMRDACNGKGGMHDKASMNWLAELERRLEQATWTSHQLFTRYQGLIARIERLAGAFRFAPLYHQKKKLFHIGYNLDTDKLDRSYYNLLASEARQASYIAIASGEIPMAHWFRMSRTLTISGRFKGLVSWTGTMFEYLMPLLIMKRYRNTLLDETYAFVIKSQMQYGKQLGIPWGVSESGFYSLDKNLDYQYKAIGVPWLGLTRESGGDWVVAPYATFLAMLIDPEAAMANLRHLKSEGLEGYYGYYEAVDYTPERLRFQAKKAIVKSYMAHHQGMCLIAIGNVLGNNIMQARFHATPIVKAARHLLQEKTPDALVLRKKAVEPVKTPKQAPAPDVDLVRSFQRPDPQLPKTCIVTNGNYTVMLTDRGTGYSRSRMAAITRWREDSTLDGYGMFFYLRDTQTNALWSAAYAPLNEIPMSYEVSFASDAATYKREDGFIDTSMQVFVTTEDNAEIRRLSIRNRGPETCTLELTSYLEVVLAPQAADVAHPAFSNLFVETSHLPQRNCLVARRRPLSVLDKEAWLANAVIVGEERIGEVQVETDRMRFLGRGRSPRDPIGVRYGKPLSGTTGPVLDPVMCLRVVLRIAPEQTAVVSYVTTIAEQYEPLMATLDRYAQPQDVQSAYLLTQARSRADARYMNFTRDELSLFQEMQSHILFASRLRTKYDAAIRRNTKGQESLWQYGVSGDAPILLVLLRRQNEMRLLRDALKAHEYWRLMGLQVDLVIICEEASGYRQSLHEQVQAIVSHRQLALPLYVRENIYLLGSSPVPPEDILLFQAFARIALVGGASMAEQVAVKQAEAAPAEIPVKPASAYAPRVRMDSAPLLYDNGLGGFTPSGDAYVVQVSDAQYTPMPWVNVIANPMFGFIATESGGGYTWYENSRQFKLTPWSNDPVSDAQGEILYITDRESGECFTVTQQPIRDVGMYRTTHGFGYTIYQHESHGLRQQLTQHVPVDAPVKISLLSIRNMSGEKRNLSATYYMQPVLGDSTQTATQHVWTGMGEGGVLQLRNFFAEAFAGHICFLDTSQEQRSVTGDRLDFFGEGGVCAPDSLRREALSGAVGGGYDPCGAMQVSISLMPGEEIKVVFLLGVAENEEALLEMRTAYGNIDGAEKGLRDVKAFWREKLQVVQVKTPNPAMDIMLNGWLIYQVISCRLWARSGFYQSGGAFGFRDQLQDVLALANTWPELTRAQIIRHAARQFVEGDVQHWWHEPTGKGIRTRFSDDLLWLPYVTAEYIRITGDMEILNEQIPFLEAPLLPDGKDEVYGQPNVTEETASLYNHCIRSIEKASKFGMHGLPLMGSGDWNDGMNMVGNKGKGESVWLGWFLVSILNAMEPLCVAMEDEARAERYANLGKTIEEAIERSAWDGKWYRRAYFDQGQPLGSQINKECRIDSIAQSWSVISRAGHPHRALQAMYSLEDHLIHWENGLAQLLTPPFDTGDMEPGYIKGYLPGVRENGGQYTHAAVWAIIAFAMQGNGNKAMALYDLINPLHHTGSPSAYAQYKAEPYVMAADVYALYPHAGRGGWSWYTGAAGWMYRAGLENILGFQKEGDILSFAPCIPESWNGYEIRYKHHQTIYMIHVVRGSQREAGCRISLDGDERKGNRIRLVNDERPHKVTVWIP